MPKWRCFSILRSFTPKTRAELSGLYLTVRTCTTAIFVPLSSWHWQRLTCAHEARAVYVAVSPSPPAGLSFVTFVCVLGRSGSEAGPLGEPALEPFEKTPGVSAGWQRGGARRRD